MNMKLKFHQHNYTELELMLRLFEDKNFQDKRWFFNSIESILYNVPYLPIFNGDLTINLLK